MLEDKQVKRKGCHSKRVCSLIICRPYNLKIIEKNSISSIFTKIPSAAR